MRKMMWLLAGVMCSLVLQPTGNLVTPETASRSPNRTLKAKSMGHSLELQPLRGASHNHDQDKYDATTKFPFHTVLKPVPVFSAQSHNDPQPVSQDQSERRGKTDLHTMWKWMGKVDIPEEIKGGGTKCEINVERNKTTLCRMKSGEEQVGLSNCSCQVKITIDKELKIHVKWTG